MQSLVFRASAANEKNSDGQDYKNWAFTGSGFATEELFKMAIDLKDAMVSYSVQGEEESAADERGAAKTGDADNKEY